MKQVSWNHIVSYLVVAVFAVGLAFMVSLRFLSRSQSQTNPPQQTPAPAKSVAPQESAAAVAAEVQGFLEPFLYDSKNRRDPFQPFSDFRPAENQQILSVFEPSFEKFDTVETQYFDCHSTFAALLVGNCHLTDKRQMIFWFII